MYLPSKYSKFSDAGSAKPVDKFVKQTPSQNVGNSQNLAANPRWKTGRSSQTNGTPSRCWLCNEVGHRAVHCKKRGATQISSSQEKRGASGKSAAGVNNVKAEPVQCNRVIIEAQNQSGTNLIGARRAQDIPKINTKNCSLSIVLTATDQKPQKSLKRWYYPPSHCLNVNVMLSNMTFLMIFAVFDPSPLTLWINCSF